MKIIKAYQIPRGSVSPTIFDLPCITACHKNLKGEVIYHFSPDAGICVFTQATDWLLEDEKGMWYNMSNDRYQAWKRSDEELK